MTKVISSASMSLDGYIAHSDDSVGALFDWYEAGPVEIPIDERFTFHMTQASADYWKSWVPDAGAIVVGRKLFDVTDGWGGHHPIDAPVVVVTHNPPTDWNPPGSEDFHFVSNGIEAAIAKAKEIAEDKIVSVAAGEIATQCLEAGLLTDVAIDLVPVVLGEGKPYFCNRGNKEILIGNPSTIVATERVTHLIYPVNNTDK